MIKKIYLLAGVMLFSVTGKTQSWHRYQIDSFVSIELPDRAVQEKIENVHLYAKEDSCLYMVQSNVADKDLKVEDFRKSLLDQYVGQGFVILSDKTFTLQQKTGAELIFLDDINDLETLKVINYVRAFALNGRLYTIAFSVARPYDSAMTARKDAFFASLQLHNLPKETETSSEKAIDDSETRDVKKVSSFVFYACAGVMLMLAFALIMRARKKKNP